LLSRDPAEFAWTDVLREFAYRIALLLQTVTVEERVVDCYVATFQVFNKEGDVRRQVEERLQDT
jgi:hypothetical protein